MKYTKKISKNSKEVKKTNFSSQKNKNKIKYLNKNCWLLTQIYMCTSEIESAGHIIMLVSVCIVS